MRSAETLSWRWSLPQEHSWRYRCLKRYVMWYARVDIGTKLSALYLFHTTELSRTKLILLFCLTAKLSAACQWTQQTCLKTRQYWQTPEETITEKTNIEENCTVTIHWGWKPMQRRGNYEAAFYCVELNYRVLCIYAYPPSLRIATNQPKLGTWRLSRLHTMEGEGGSLPAYWVNSLLWRASRGGNGQTPYQWRSWKQPVQIARLSRWVVS